MERKCVLVIKQLNDVLERNANNDLRPQGLTLSQSAVLVNLNNRKDKACSITVMAKDIHIAQPTMTGIANRLAAKGFIEYITDENDRRSKLIHLTKAGESSCREGQKNMEQTEERLLRSLDEEERKTLLDLLSRIAGDTMTGDWI